MPLAFRVASEAFLCGFVVMEKVKQRLAWYLRFLVACAMLGLISGVARALTGIDFAATEVAQTPNEFFGAAVPPPRQMLMLLMAALFAVLMQLRRQTGTVGSGTSPALATKAGRNR